MLKADGDREAERYSENADFTGNIPEFHPNANLASSRVCTMGVSPFCALVSQPAKTVSPSFSSLRNAVRIM